MTILPAALAVVLALAAATAPVHAVAPEHLRPQTRPVQRGYTTNVKSPASVQTAYLPKGPLPSGYNAGAIIAAPVGYNPGGPVGYNPNAAIAGPVGSLGGPDFNPALAAGVRGYPGVRARVNSRAFQYFSQLIAPILDQEIKRARLPPITQDIKEVNGCVQVYNLYVSRYRCPQKVAIYPAPPNKIVFSVQNLDVGVTGNLGGQIVILLPIKLFGIVQVNLYQVSVTVELVVSRSVAGTPTIQVAGCSASVGYVDAWIENGGLVGDIANSQFRGQISNQIRQMIPGQLCSQIPQLVNSKLGGQLGNLPQSIPLTQMLQLANSAFGLAGIGRGGQCAPGCQAAVKPIGVPVPSPATIVTPVPAVPYQATAQRQPLPAVPAPAAAAAAGPPQDPPPPASYSPSATQGPKPLPSGSPYARRHVRVLASGSTRLLQKPISHAHHVAVNGSHFVTRTRRSAPHAKVPTRARKHRTTAVAAPRARVHGTGPIKGPIGGYQGPIAGGYQGLGPVSGGDPCAGCPGAAGNGGTLSQLQELTKYLDLTKLNDILLSLQIVQLSATPYDYTVDLSGEFSPGGYGGTPFGPFPMFFPSPVGNRMAEILISDYTVNSLFYTLHRKGFLQIRLGPETPRIGPLLKTTCNDDDEDDELEDHGVEVDEDEDESGSEETETTTKKASEDEDDDDDVRKAVKARSRRQADDGGLADLGICFGDILPVAREKYPNTNIIINVRTARAPSIVISGRNGGLVIFDLVADADLSTEQGQRVGTIRIEAVFEVTVRTTPTFISGHGEITRLHLSNPDQSLGLTQEALDNLGNLGKEMVAKAANDVLEKGMPLSLPAGGVGLPIHLIAPGFHFVEHGVLIETDFSIAPTFLASLAGGSIGGGGSCRR